jgi:hypothetical protein
MPNPYGMPGTRPLRVYAFDPSAGRELNNYLTLNVDYENLSPGPVGRRIAVLDYDASNSLFYEPVDLDQPAVLLSGGLEPSESDPRFHQQMVYAVACESVRRFEFALGRPIRWRVPPSSRRNSPYHGRLRIFPHAFQQANAFYDPRLCAVLFGYFAASGTDCGDALPGQTIFTCLSHDIIVHELTHALIDGQREFLTDATGPDAAAFHEAFADIVALFQHFAYREALLETIHRTGGLIYKRQFDPLVSPGAERASIIPELSADNPLVGLARQFGQALGHRAALREAIGSPPDPAALATTTEPHQRGAILVAAVFDAFFTLYIKRTRDLMRIARAGGAVSAGGDLHPDLALRLADEAARIAVRFANVLIRALDYCPPVDLEFGEFLRAVITADSDLVPHDPHGYRAELIKAFRLRGIIPSGVSSCSEESLRWSGPASRHGSVGRCDGLLYSVFAEDDPESLREREARNRHNAIRLNAYARQFAAHLGLDPKLPIQPHSYHPIHRISPSGKIVVDFVVEFLQQKQEPLDPHTPRSPKISYHGGSTVIFNHRGEVRYAIEKSIRNQSRLARQKSFLLESWGRSAAAPYLPANPSPRINFQLVHSGL